LECAKGALDRLLYGRVRDVSLRAGLTEGAREARGELLVEDRARLDALLDQTVERCGAEPGRDRN
jgi:hypothetical protein